MIKITRGSCPGRGMSCCKQVQSVPLRLLLLYVQENNKPNKSMNMQESGISTFQTNCGTQRVLLIDQS